MHALVLLTTTYRQFVVDFTELASWVLENVFSQTPLQAVPWQGEHREPWTTAETIVSSHQENLFPRLVVFKGHGPVLPFPHFPEKNRTVMSFSTMEDLELILKNFYWNVRQLCHPSAYAILRKQK